MQHPPAKFRPALLLAFVLFIGLTAAWQNPPPLSLTAAVDPAMAASGQMVTVTLTIANTGDASLEDVEITATVPRGTDFERAAADPVHTGQQWDIDLSEGVVRYRATGPLPAGERAQVTLVVTVLPEAGMSIVFDTYEATAKGLESPVKGEPVSIEIAATPTSRATQTPTTTVTGTLPADTPTATAAVTGTLPADTPTPTAVATATPEPTPSATTTPEPTPTITVVVAELPPTPTPNLSTEQEVIGTVTVLVFVGIVVVIIAAAVIWIVRSGKSA